MPMKNCVLFVIGFWSQQMIQKRKKKNVIGPMKRAQTKSLIQEISFVCSCWVHHSGKEAYWIHMFSGALSGVFRRVISLRIDSKCAGFSEDQCGGLSGDGLMSSHRWVHLRKEEFNKSRPWKEKSDLKWLLYNGSVFLMFSWCRRKTTACYQRRGIWWVWVTAW